VASEELENSLRTEVEGYVNSRLSGILEEISRLQSQTNEMFTRFMERLSDDVQQDAPIYAAISEHLRASHKRGIEEAAAGSMGTKASSDVAILKASIDEINEQQSQANILTSLVNHAASFAPRVAFFVVKNDHAIGWRARGLEGSVGDDSVREIALPLSAKTLLSDTVELRSTWSGEPGANAEDHLLLSKLGDESPQRMVAIPLVARNKAAAVLYADSAKLGPEAINLEALETLVRVSGMAVELLAARRATSAPGTSAASTSVQPAAQPATQPAESPRPAPAVTTPTAPLPVAPPVSAPLPPLPTAVSIPEAPVEEAKPAPKTPERAPAEHFPTVDLEDVASNGEAATATPPVPAPSAKPAPTPSTSWTEAQKITTAPLEVKREIAEPKIEATPVVTTTPPVSIPSTPAAPPPPPSTTPAPAEAAPATVTAPLGSARQYGRGAEVELPVEVGEGEKRLHIDARRFARLLVSEIKLYNEEKVQKGRGEGDLYERLREEIDRSRMMYEKRVSPNVASRYDYFHQELVNTLAEGKADKLGRSYPGASVNS
jgi:hypothetical protein